MFRKKVAVAGLAVAALMMSASFALADSNGIPDSPPHVDTSGVNMQPAYPQSALGGREKGTVIVEVFVQENGKVRRIRLRKPSGFSDLDDAAVAAVMGWHFTPAIKDGQRVEDWTAVQVEFEPPAISASY